MPLCGRLRPHDADLALSEVVELHRRLLEAAGGAAGIRDLGALESAVAQPKVTLASAELYPTLVEKAAALLSTQGVGVRTLKAATARPPGVTWGPSNAPAKPDRSNRMLDGRFRDGQRRSTE
jgi:hypothetical protein